MNILLRGVRAARTALLRSSWSVASSPLLGVPGHSLLHVDTSRPAEPEDTFVRKQVREGRLDLRSPEKTFDHFTNDELHRASTWLGEIIGHTPTEAELYMFTAGVLRELEDRGIEPGFLPLPDRDDPALNDYLTKYSDMWGVDARPPPRFLAEHIVDQHHPPEPLEPGFAVPLAANLWYFIGSYDMRQASRSGLMKKLIAVVNDLEGSGKTSLACVLNQTYAEAGYRTLMVATDEAEIASASS